LANEKKYLFGGSLADFLARILDDFLWERETKKKDSLFCNGNYFIGSI